MNDDNQIFDNIYTNLGNEKIHDKLKQKFLKSIERKYKILEKFEEIDNCVDNEILEKHLEDDNIGFKNTRKNKHLKVGTKLNIMHHANFKDDFDEIFFGKKNLIFDKKIEFQKNDKVTFIINRKKYNGIIYQIYNDKDLIIKTNDRKKIKLLWKNIDGKKIQIYKNDI